VSQTIPGASASDPDVSEAVAVKCYLGFCQVSVD